MSAPETRRPEWAFIIAGFASLLLSAYDDVARGPLLPAMAAELHLEFTGSGAFLAVCSGVAVVCALVLVWALNHVSERTVLVAVCLVGFVTALAAPSVGSFGGMLALAVGLGTTISVLGTMCNVLIVEGAPPHLQGRLLSALHAMYGLGSMTAASVVGWGLGRGIRWAHLYTAAAPLFLLLLGFAAARLRRRHGHVRTVQSPRLSPLQAFVVALFALYVAGEAGVSLWLTSDLVSDRGFSVEKAAAYLTAYFFVMTLTRLACATWITPAREKTVLRLALVLPLAAFAAGQAGAAPAFVLMGTFGPFFPLFLARLSRRFPDAWRSMTLWTMTAIPAAIALTSLAVGRLADSYGMAAAFLLPPGLLALALVLLQCYFVAERRGGGRPDARPDAASA